MKTHGLWQWHRALRTSGREIKWWASEVELTKADNLASWWMRREEWCYRPLTVITRCAHRYFRRRGLEPTVGEWNQLVDIICDRRGAAHITRRSAKRHALEEQDNYLQLLSSRRYKTSDHGLDPTQPHASPLLRLDEVRRSVSLALTRTDLAWTHIETRTYMPNSSERLYRKLVADATSESTLKWSELPSDSDRASEWNQCEVCGGYCGRVKRHGYRWKGVNQLTAELGDTDNRDFRVSRPVTKAGYRRMQVCLKPLCRAIAYLSPKPSYPKKPLLLGVLDECTKHKGDNPLYRGLAKHFARHAGGLHQRKN